MLAAGAGVGLVLVAAGVLVVLGFIHFANRRGGGDATPWAGTTGRRISRAPLAGAPWAAQAGPLAEVVTSGTGTDADAGEYLND